MSFFLYLGNLKLGKIMKTNHFAKKLKKLRIDKGHTLKEVATGIDVPLTTYREWEYGRETKGVHPLIKLADFYQIGLNELIRGESQYSLGDVIFIVKKIEKELEKIKKNVSSFL